MLGASCMSAFAKALRSCAGGWWARPWAVWTVRRGHAHGSFGVTWTLGLVTPGGRLGATPGCATGTLAGDVRSLATDANLGTYAVGPRPLALLEPWWLAG